MSLPACDTSIAYGKACRGVEEVAESYLGLSKSVAKINEAPVKVKMQSSQFVVPQLRVVTHGNAVWLPAMFFCFVAARYCVSSSLVYRGG